MVYRSDTTEHGKQNGWQNTELRKIKFTDVSLNDVSRPGDGDVGRGSVETAGARARIFKLLRSPEIYSKENHSAILCSHAARYDNPIFLLGIYDHFFCQYILYSDNPESPPSLADFLDRKVYTSDTRMAC